MSELVDRLVKAVGENHRRRYESEYSAGHLDWGDFASEAIEDIATVLRELDADGGMIARGGGNVESFAALADEIEGRP